MIVVSNTTPLRYLIAIRQDHVLAGLFTKIHIPLSVFEELTHLRTPELVRQRVSSVPPWLEVHRIALPEPSLLQRRVHRGERDAIALLNHSPRNSCSSMKKTGASPPQIAVSN